MANDTDKKDKDLKKPTQLPPGVGSPFAKNPSMFSGNKGPQKGFSGPRFIPPQIRITQNKGGGGK